MFSSRSVGVGCGGVGVEQRQESKGGTIKHMNKPQCTPDQSFEAGWLIRSKC